MHLAFVTLGLAPFDKGGPSTVAYHLIKQFLTRKDIRLTLLVGSSATKNEIVNTFGDGFENVFRWPLEQTVWYYMKRIKETWQTLEDFDVLHVSNFNRVRDFYLPLFAWIRKIPSVYTIHGWISREIMDLFPQERLQRLKSMVVKAFYDFENPLWSRVVVCSEFMKNIVVKYEGLDERKICMIHHGIDQDAIRRMPRISLEGNIKILYIGRLEQEKGVDLILQALSILDPDIKRRIRLYIAGSGTLECYLKSLACGLKVDRYVEFLGSLPLYQCYSLYKSCDIFVATSRREDFPMTILEALGAGVPIIATRVGGIPEIVEHKRNGLLVSLDPFEIARKIKYLVEFPEVRKKIRRNNLMKARKYTWPMVAERYLNLYKSLTGM